MPGIFDWLTGGQKSNNNGAKDALAPRNFKPQKSTFSFADVAGCDEAKAEMQEIVDALRDPSEFIAMGARMPKGIMLMGPPGNGKTLLARATAGEAGVPFFSVSGSDFVEKYVGVGAARVRELFAEAKKFNAAIIFIDEIDAVGKRRDASGEGGNSERDQTLNQILVEMDGFNVNSAIIVMAATNRLDTLDPALIRAGRFDRQIAVDSPEREGRKAIFGIHTKGKPLGPDVNFDLLATRTPGVSGADIAAISNEAAILAARRRIAAKQQGLVIEKTITMADFDEAIDRVSMGVARNSRAKAMTLRERKNTTYHELCHAAVAMAMEDADPVTKITILPRARALGYVQYQPETDRYSLTEEQMRARIMIAMGGRIGSQVFLNETDTGPSNDFEQATATAHAMVTKYGMSAKVGPMHVPDDPRAVSPELARLVDSEVRRILTECEREARRIILANRDRVERCAVVLLEKETILGPEFKELWGESPKWKFSTRRPFLGRIRNGISSLWGKLFNDSRPVAQ